MMRVDRSFLLLMSACLGLQSVAVEAADVTGGAVSANTPYPAEENAGARDGRASKETERESAPEEHFKRVGFADQADKLLPAVVNVAVWRKSSSREDLIFPGSGGPFEDLLREFFKRGRSSESPGRRVEKKRIHSLGSGFVVRCVPLSQEKERVQAANQGKLPAHFSQGTGKKFISYVVTNRHVIESGLQKNSSFKADAGASVTIRLQSGEDVNAQIVGSDPSCDVAVLCFYTDEMVPTLTWGDSSRIRTGHWVLAAGNPFGLGGTMTHGVVSHTKRETHGESGPSAKVYLQTDVAMNSGNSGGPLVNMDTEVIGVNVAIYSPTGGSVGISLSVPADLAKEVTNQLIDKGIATYGMIGLEMREEPVYKNTAKGLNMPRKVGIFVIQVLKDMPAAKAGIKAGDIILEVNGKEVASLPQVKREISTKKVAELVAVKVWRPASRQILDFSVPVQKMELSFGKDDAADTKNTIMGIQFQEKTQDAKDSAPKRRVVIAAIEEDSPAFRFLQPGDEVRSIGAYTVTSAAHAVAALKKLKQDEEKALIFDILRQGQEYSILIDLGSDNEGL